MLVTRASRSSTVVAATMDPQNRKWVMMIAASVVAVYLAVSFSQSNNSDGNNALHTRHSTDSLDTCKVSSPIIQPSTPPPNKPFWVPKYPDTDHGVVASLVMALTGEFTAAKNYYASSPSLKKCFSHSSITVICEQIHPVVSIGTAPQHQSSKFQSQIILPIRNPMTAIPEHAQAKAVMYHKATSQVSLDYWRSFRDSWLETTAVQGWMDIITEWKNMTEYKNGVVGLYMPYEDLLDTFKGPKLTIQLATMIRDAGFAVIDPTNTADMTCIWYQAVKHHMLAKHPLHEYATDYIPHYTLSQKQYMIRQLTVVRDLYPADEALQLILNTYIADIQANKVNDAKAKPKQPEGKAANAASKDGKNGKRYHLR